MSIITKNSSTGDAAPLVGDLVEGELAVNTVDGLLFTRDNANNVTRLGIIKQGATTNKIPRFDGTDWIPATGTSLSSGGSLTVAGLIANANVQCVDVVASGDVGCVDVNATGTVDAAAFTGDGSGLTGLPASGIADTAETDGQVRVAGSWVAGLQIIDTDTALSAPVKGEVLTAAEYGAITPDADTLYFVTV